MDGYELVLLGEDPLGATARRMASISGVQGEHGAFLIRVGGSTGCFPGEWLNTEGCNGFVEPGKTGIKLS